MNSGEKCQYEANDGETITGSLRRRIGTLEQENTSLRELLETIQDRPQVDSQEIIRRLRISDDPLVVLETLKQADILLPRPG